MDLSRKEINKIDNSLNEYLHLADSLQKHNFLTRIHFEEGVKVISIKKIGIKKSSKF